MWDLDALLLARIQFGFTISFHIIFPAITIGLASYLAVLEACLLRTGKFFAIFTISGFGTQKGSHLKVYLNGKQSIIPMHNTDLKTGTVAGIKKQLGLK